MAAVKNVVMEESEDNIIRYPKGMSLKQLSEWALRKDQEEQKVVAFREELTGAYPLDALVCFNKALAKIHGWVDLRPTPGFFGSTPPTMLSVPISVNDTMQVAYGNFQVPNIEGTITTAWNMSPGRRPSFIISGNVRQKSVPKVKEIAQMTKQLLITDSIYKGKAIQVNWDWERLGNDFDIMEDSPKFMDLHEVKPNELILSKDVQKMLSIGLWRLIDQYDCCKACGIPIKRGVLLAGRYGVGKTLAMLVTALKAINHGFTFMHMKSVLDLPRCVEASRHYAKCVAFGEDVDEIIGTQDDTSVVRMINNCFDGIDSKQHEVIVALTTNHPERLHKGFIRPGRIDIVVPMTPPDADAAARLVQLYGRGLLSPETNFAVVGEKLQGKIAAVNREIIERSKLAAIDRLASELPEDTPVDPAAVVGQIFDPDIVDAAKSIEAHEAMLKEPEEPKDPTYLIKMKVGVPEPESSGWYTREDGNHAEEEE